MLAAAARIESTLTATLQVSEDDDPVAACLLFQLEVKVGHIMVNGWPPGGDVGQPLVHGCPFPATSDSHITSVWTLAINRLLRPVAYQSVL